MRPFPLLRALSASSLGTKSGKLLGPKMKPAICMRTSSPVHWPASDQLVGSHEICPHAREALVLGSLCALGLLTGHRRGERESSFSWSPLTLSSAPSSAIDHLSVCRHEHCSSGRCRHRWSSSLPKHQHRHARTALAKTQAGECARMQKRVK